MKEVMPITRDAEERMLILGRFQDSEKQGGRK
jgi:hypothetical protein